ncbi:MAG: hypothetical protein ACU0AT_06125 [Tranquillimonas sp.]
MRHKRTAGASTGLLLLLAAGAAAYAYWQRNRRPARLGPAPVLPPPAFGRQDAERLALPDSSGNAGPVREAGPDAMRDPPAHWDLQDEASDESFPASDSAAKY